MIDNNDFLPDLSQVVTNLPTNQYLILINGIPFSEGSLEKVQEEVRALLFGENEKVKDVEPNDIIVLKRVKVNVGVFLE